MNTLTTKQIAQYCDINVHYARNLMRDGTIDAFKTETGAWRATQEAVDEWNDSRSGRGGGTFELLDHTDGEWCSLKEAAEIAGISRVYARRCVLNGKMEGEKRNGNWWVKTASAESFERTRSEDDGILYQLKLTEEELQELRDAGYELRRKNR